MRHFSTLGGSAAAAAAGINVGRKSNNAFSSHTMMPNPDDILPRAAWTDYSGGTMDDKWSEELMLIKNNDCGGGKQQSRQRRTNRKDFEVDEKLLLQQESEPLLLSPTARNRLSVQTTTTEDAMSTSSPLNEDGPIPRPRNVRQSSDEDEDDEDDEDPDYRRRRRRRRRLAGSNPPIAAPRACDSTPNSSNGSSSVQR